MDEDVRVLLIEDDEAVAEMYQFRLSADGYVVSIARDGEEGLRKARAEAPDLIYLDLGLPKVDGIEVLSRLRADDATAVIPVVILTNFDEPELRNRGLTLGALEFLLKAGTTPAELSANTGRWVETGERPPVQA